MIMLKGGGIYLELWLVNWYDATTQGVLNDL